MQRRMLTDLADVLRAAGQKVIEIPGWKTRGESDGPGFDPIGIMLHHDAMALGWNSNPADDLNVPKYMAQNGVNGAELWVSRRGVWVVLAAGRKWHAGVGQGWGDVPADSGNSYLLGVETDHTDGDPWPAGQRDAINEGCRALVRHYEWKASNCCGHKEYAPGRKHDPSGWDLDAWRRYIAGGGKPSPVTPGTTYTVRPGDTLSDIAADYGTTVAALVSLNNITDPDRIDVGQVIRLASKEAPVTQPKSQTPQQRYDELAKQYGIGTAAFDHFRTQFDKIVNATDESAARRYLVDLSAMFEGKTYTVDQWLHLLRARLNVEMAQ